MFLPETFLITGEMLAISTMVGKLTSWIINHQHFYTVKIKNNGSRHINSIFKTKGIMVAHSSVYCYTLPNVFIYALLLSLRVFYASHNLQELWISSSMHTHHFTPSTFPFYWTSKTRDLLTINQLFHSPQVSAPDNLWIMNQNCSISTTYLCRNYSHTWLFHIG